MTGVVYFLWDDDTEESDKLGFVAVPRSEIRQIEASTYRVYVYLTGYARNIEIPLEWEDDSDEGSVRASARRLRKIAKEIYESLVQAVDTDVTWTRNMKGWAKTESRPR